MGALLPSVYTCFTYNVYSVKKIYIHSIYKKRGDNIIYQIKKNQHFYELITYSLNSDNNLKNEDRERDYEIESGARAKRTIIDYGLNNDFNFMINITLDQKKVNDRTDEYITSKILKDLNNIKNRYDPELQYILVPEYHKREEENGKRAIHYHGLIKISKEHINKLMKYMYTKDNKIYYRHNTFYNKYGASNFIEIYNKAEFTAYYMSKYIGKQFYAMINDQYYFASKSLKKSHIIFETDKFKIDKEPTYSGQFTSKWKLTREELQGLMLDNKVSINY